MVEHLDQEPGGRRFDSCWENSDFFFLSDSLSKHLSQLLHIFKSFLSGKTNHCFCKCFFRPGDAQKTFLGVLFKQDEMDVYQVMEEHIPEENVRKKQPDKHKKQCDDTKKLRSEVAQLDKEKSSDDGHAYEEMEYPREISHRAFSNRKSKERQKKQY